MRGWPAFDKTGEGICWGAANMARTPHTAITKEKKKKRIGLFFKLYIECGDFGRTHFILGHLDSGFSEYWL